MLQGGLQKNSLKCKLFAFQWGGRVNPEMHFSFHRQLRTFDMDPKGVQGQDTQG